jgi:AcrR family transcriptional regulator
VAAMIELAAEEGYGAVRIGELVTLAGVSRPTFYEYFKEKSDCLRAAIEHLQQRLLGEARERIAGGGSQEALAAALRALVAFASSSPRQARVLMVESMAGGPRALDARDQGIGAIASVVEGVYETAPGGASAPDVSPALAIGGVYRLLACRLRRGEEVREELSEELARWLAAYARPLDRHRWRALSPSAPRTIPDASPPLLKPARPAKKATRPSEQATAERERILFAAAEIAEQDGYAAASIAEICKRAGVDHRAFHRAFERRRDVIAALHERFFQHLMTVSAGAFFGEASWPERIWDAGLAFGQSAEQEPTLAYVSFVEGPAAGPEAVQRYDDLVNAFTIFLEQGDQQGSEANGPSTVAREAIAWTTHEANYARARTHGEQGIVELLAPLAFVVLAPFLGVAAADRFIDRKLGEEPS